MSMRRIVLTGALACGAPAAAAAAQTPAGGAADSAWVNRFSISQLRDELADRPDSASLDPRNTTGGTFLDLPVVLPEPFHSRAFVADSYLLLEVDSAGRAARCRPLRAGTHPELDAFACTLLTGPRANVVKALQLAAGRRVVALRWQSLTAAAHRQRESGFQGRGRAEGTYRLNPPPPPRPSETRRRIRGEVAASDYRRIADQRMSEGQIDAELVVDDRGVPTGCRVARSSGNQAIDERTCALLVDRVRFTPRADSSGTPVADTVTLAIDVDRMLSSRPPFAQPIQVGQTVSGRLESGDRVSANGTFYDEYTFTAPSATSLRITMRSNELGPSLRVTFDHPPYVLGEGRSGTSGSYEVKVSVDVGAGESVRIQAGAYSRGMQGAYTLQVTAN